MADPSVDGKIRDLQRIFGNQIERDVLEAVLGVCGGDVKACERYLTAGQNDYVDPGPSSSSSLPKDYGMNPKGYTADKMAKLFEPLLRTNPLSEPILRMKNVIFQDGSLRDHFEVYKADPAVYTGVAGLMIHLNVEFAAPVKPKILATALSFRCSSLTKYILSKKEHFQMIDILRAIKMLDAPRKCRALEKKINALTQKGAKASKMRPYQRKLHEIRTESDTHDMQVSVSGSTAVKIRRWIRTVACEDLEFYLMHMPTQPWRDLADIVHPNPTDFQLPYFLACVYGAEPPVDSAVAKAKLVKLMSPEDVEALLAHTHIPYSFLRKNLEVITNGMRERIAEYENIDTLIWWYHELGCAGVDERIRARLEKGEEPKFSYGKFMERLLYFKEHNSPFFPLLIPIAEKRLKEIYVPLEPPVIVIGDASFSMDVAIRTSTIISSLMAVLTNAKLLFFNDKAVEPPLIPKNVSEVLMVTERARADGLTAPASAIYELYKLQQKVKYIVMVTDEIENEKFSDSFFAQLFYQYCVEVYPARLVFISFLEDPKVKGRMVRALEGFGITPLQFRLDAKLPDLTKLDSVLGMISSEGTLFPVIVSHIVNMISLSPGGCLSSVIEKAVSIAAPPPDDLSPQASSSSSSLSALTLSPSPAPAPAAAPVDIRAEAVDEAPSSSLLSSHDKDLCVVCMEHAVDTACIPCGHASFCNGCAFKLQGKPCPVCRVNVENILRIFRS